VLADEINNDTVVIDVADRQGVGVFPAARRVTKPDIPAASNRRQFMAARNDGGLDDFTGDVAFNVETARSSSPLTCSSLGGAI
jgi:hypothetical protein